MAGVSKARICHRRAPRKGAPKKGSPLGRITFCRPGFPIPSRLPSEFYVILRALKLVSELIFSLLLVPLYILSSSLRIVFLRVSLLRYVARAKKKRLGSLFTLRSSPLILRHQRMPAPLYVVFAPTN